jgi:CPA1 family monovalent cation:H+ antiporter
MFAPRIPLRWQHVLFWGGMRGALSLALGLSLTSNFPYRSQLLSMTFGVVAFTIVVQGITMKPLLRLLGTKETREDDYSMARIRQVAVASALSELEDMRNGYIISVPVYNQLRRTLDEELESASDTINLAFAKDRDRLSDEFENARKRLIAAEKSAVEQALHNRLLSARTASKLFDEIDQSFDQPLVPPRNSAAGGNS